MVKSTIHTKRGGAVELTACDLQSLKVENKQMLNFYGRERYDIYKTEYLVYFTKLNIYTQHIYRITVSLILLELVFA